MKRLPAALLVPLVLWGCQSAPATGTPAAVTETVPAVATATLPAAAEPPTTAGEPTRPAEDTAAPTTQIPVPAIPPIVNELPGSELPPGFSLIRYAELYRISYGLP